jgi:hypothetical protein
MKLKSTLTAAMACHLRKRSERPFAPHHGL